MGLINSKKQRHDKAVELLEKAVEFNETNATLHYTLALEYLAILRFEDAINSFLNVLKYDDSKATIIYKNVGDICYYKLKDVRNTRKYYEKYIKSGGTNAKVQSILKTLK
jgi:tetratricopeptide (TPR) repeat protein